MKDEKRGMGFSAQKRKVRSAVLLGTALSSVFALSFKVQAQTLCSSTTTTGCTITGTVNNGGLLPPSGGAILALTNTGVVQNTGDSGDVGNDAQGIANNNTLRTLTNSGTIRAIAGAGAGSGGGTGTLGNTHTRVQESIGADSSAISAQIASVAAFTPSAGIQMAGNNAPWKLAANWNGEFAKRANGQAFTLNGSYAF